MADEEILNIHTRQDVKCMMSQYKRRKQRSAMPSANRVNPFIRKKTASNESIDPEIENQRNCSLQKDSEAQIDVWNELIVILLDLAAQLSDSEFKTILPLIFPGVKTLTIHVENAGIKQQIAEFFHKVASVYGFSTN